MKDGGEDETNGRHIISPWVLAACQDCSSPRILDVGAGYGADLLAVREAAPLAELSAIEGNPPAIDYLKRQGVDVVSIDLECDPLPFADNHFDVVFCNQVVEHVKEIFWLMAEIGRVAKPGAAIIIGVPNLGSLHNRIALLLGKQPPAIHVFGPHVRGFTISGFRDFIEFGGYFAVQEIVGGNFYPFPQKIARRLSAWFPGFAVSTFYRLSKERSGSFLEVLDTPRAEELVDTPYYRGERPIKKAS